MREDVLLAWVCFSAEGVAGALAFLFLSDAAGMDAAFSSTAGEESWKPGRSLHSTAADDGGGVSAAPPFVSFTRV